MAKSPSPSKHRCPEITQPNISHVTKLLTLHLLYPIAVLRSTVLTSAYKASLSQVATSPTLIASLSNSIHTPIYLLPPTKHSRTLSHILPHSHAHDLSPLNQPRSIPHPRNPVKAAPQKQKKRSMRALNHRISLRFPGRWSCWEPIVLLVAGSTVVTLKDPHANQARRR
jgi:hypothetical protein